MKKLYALISTLSVFITLNIFAATVWDIHLFPNPPKSKYTSAAIAVRDDVPKYQKLATKLFSKPWLYQLYNHVYYIDSPEENLQRTAFASSLNEAFTKYDSIDIFLLAHSNMIVDWAKEVKSEYKSKIRLVYNCGCDNFNQAVEWAAQGVKYYLGHRGKKSLSPVFWFFFLKRWASGHSLLKSIETANRKTFFSLRLIGFSKIKARESIADIYTN